MNAQNRRLSDLILFPAFDYNASDIHIVQGVPPVYRIDGEVYKMPQLNLSPLKWEDSTGTYRQATPFN